MTGPRGLDYQNALRKAIVKAVLEQSEVDIDGSKAGLIGVDDVCVALTSLLAELYATSPDINTPRDARLAAEALRKDFHAFLKMYLENRGDHPVIPVFRTN